jgi:hypothetical protein
MDRWGVLSRDEKIGGRVIENEADESLSLNPQVAYR